MQHTLQLEAIRDVVSQTFAEYTSDPAELSETLLIRDGFYCGRCFTCGTVRAVWFAEDNIVKFYGKDRQFLASHHVDGTEHGAEDGGTHGGVDGERRRAA